MRISDLTNGEKSKRAGHWRLEISAPDSRIEDYATHIHQVFHYRTLMIEWNCKNPNDENLWIGTGFGSVSDQGGINQLCKSLGIPYRMSRYDGVSRIREVA